MKCASLATVGKSRGYPGSPVLLAIIRASIAETCGQTQARHRLGVVSGLGAMAR